MLLRNRSVLGERQMLGIVSGPVESRWSGFVDEFMFP